MLSLPLSVERGLVKRHRSCKSPAGRVIIYAYPFPGTEKLELPCTAQNRPRERVSEAKWQAMRLQLHYLDSFDKEYGAGAGMQHRPTFPILEECIVAT